jgi:DNA repair photolyase
MKINLILFVAFSFLVSPVMADKPDSAAKVKPTAAQKAAMDAGEAYDEASEEPSDEAAVKVKEKKKQKKKKKDKSAKSEKSEKSAKSKKSAKGEMGDEDEQNEENDVSSELTGLDKQRVKKAEQLQNEINKGSDTAIAARTENSKKWWKFWGE